MRDLGQNYCKYRKIFSVLTTILGSLTLVCGLMIRTAQADDVSFPTNMSVGAGLEADLTLSGANITGIISMDLSFTFNPSVLQMKTNGGGDPVVNRGSSAQGLGCEDPAEITNVDNTAGTATLSFFCTSEISTAGPLLIFTFNVIGAATSSSNLTITACTLSSLSGGEGSPTCNTTNGSVNVVNSNTIAGKIIYYNGLALASQPPASGAQRLVPDVEVALSGDVNGSDTTGTDGAYSLTGIVNVTTAPTKEGDNTQITAFDAALIARAAALIPGAALNDLQLIASDTSGDGNPGSVPTALDASRAAQFSAGRIDQIKIGDDCGTDFVFIPIPTAAANQTTTNPNTDTDPTCGPFGQISYTPLAANVTNQDYVAILIGDVSGNWQPPAAPPLIFGASNSGSDQSRALVRVTRRAGRSGTDVTVPVSLRRGNGRVEQTPIGVTVDIQFDPSMLTPVAIEQTALSQNMQVETNLSELQDDSDILKIVLYGTEGLDRKNGQLFRVVFNIQGDTPGKTPVVVSRALVDGSPAETHDGWINVR